MDNSDIAIYRLFLSIPIPALAFLNQLAGVAVYLPAHLYREDRYRWQASSYKG